MKKDIRYVCKLSSDLDKLEKESFIYIFNTVFGLDYDMEWFNWKYLDNVYGDSYIVLAYYGDKAVGSRSFWRNDIDGYKCYQPCDTAVLKEFRGMGIFTKMTLIALEKTKGAFIYNYPNNNSRPGYLKLGWNINKHCYLRPVFRTSRLKYSCKHIDDDYLVWKFGKSPLKKYFYYEKYGQSYLLNKRKGNIYYVLGSFNKKYNSYFIKANFPILFDYANEETFIYKLFKNRATIVSFDKENEYKEKIDIPIFKGDHF